MDETKLNFSFYIRTLSFVLSVFATKTAAVSWSIFILTCFYIFDSYHQKIILLPGSGALIIVFGLILTIKHNYLINIESVTALIAKQNSLLKFSSLGWETDPKNIEKAKTAASDEGTGLVIIIVGSLIGALAPIIPLISLCKPL
jgi:hypothetical protein